MCWPHKLLMQLRTLFQRRQADARLDTEIQFHLDQQIAENIAAGMPAEEARHAAMRTFGNPTLLKEQAHETWGWVWLEQIARDVRYAVRQLRKSPGFAVTAILTLALGIGITTVMYSLLYATLLKQLPYPHPRELMALYETLPEGGTGTVSLPNFLDWQKQNSVFRYMTTYTTGMDALRNGNNAQHVEELAVTPDFLRTLGVHPVLGRDFLHEEDQPGHDRVLLLTAQLWRERCHANPDIVGQKVDLGGLPYTVIGVLPQNYRFSMGIVMPLEVTPDLLKSRGNHQFFVIGRLKPGVRVAAAQSNMDIIAKRLEKQYPVEQAKRGILVRNFQLDQTNWFRSVLWTLGGAVLLVLAIACANVAGLQLSRTAVRMPEIALRQAVGASRGRLVRQLLTENGLLGLFGCGLGLALAYVGLRAALSLHSFQLASTAYNIRLSWPVCLFTLGISLASSLAFGLAPALLASRNRNLAVLRETSNASTGGMRSNRSRSTLVVTQVALSVVLLSALGLLIKVLWKLEHVDPGFSAAHIITMNVGEPETMSNDKDPYGDLWLPIENKLRTLPGVESVGYISLLPLQASGTNGEVQILGRPVLGPGKDPYAEWRLVGGDYFHALRIPVVHGRLFDQRDYGRSEPTVLINEAFANKYFNHENPVGQRVKLSDTESAPIVGVVASVRQVTLDHPPAPEIYFSLSRATGFWQPGSLHLAVRFLPGAPVSAASIQAAIRSVSPDADIADVETMRQILRHSMNDERIITGILGVFGGLALLLAMIGLYGLMSYAAVQRAREIGIRLALGAQRGQIQRLFLREAFRLVAVGIAVGIALSAISGKLLQTILLGVVHAADFATWSIVLLTLIVVALVAAFIPARRAASIDPMQALRAE